MEAKARDVCSVDYEREYENMLMENAALKEKNATLIEALVKIITKVL